MKIYLLILVIITAACVIYKVFKNRPVCLKTIESPSELIKLTQKLEKVSLPVLKVIVYIKRLNYLEGTEYLNGDNSHENLFFLAICNKKGEKLFESKEQCKTFLNQLDAVDFSHLVTHLNAFNFPKIETIEKNS